MVQHTCAQCGVLFDRDENATGQKASWCVECRRRYMRSYHRTRNPIKPRVPKPPKPPKPTLSCRICEAECPPGRRSLCGARECELENGRRIARQRRRDKPESFLATREQGWRRRRARKRLVHSEPYVSTAIAERDRWTCHLCGKKIPRSAKSPHPMSLTMDHVIPLAEGGDDTPANVKAAHRLCNSVKGHRVHPGGEQLLLVG